MQWITQEQAKKAAEQGELPALECSLEHHQQGRDASKSELIEAIINNNFDLGREVCACCQFVGKTTDGQEWSKCERCSLGKQFCWKDVETVWDKIRSSWTVLTDDYSNEKVKSFQEAEAELCTYIEAVIEKVKVKEKKCEKYEPKLRHGDYGHYESGGFWWAWERKGFLELFGTVEGSGRRIQDTIQDTRSDIVKDGNHVDDLERNSQDLEEFEMQTAGGGILQIKQRNFCTGEAGVRFNIDGFHATAALNQAIEIHQKLGQVVAYVKRKQEKSKC